MIFRSISVAATISMIFLIVSNRVQAETTQLFEVCHGEFRSVCSKHHFHVWEDCNARNGVRGFDPEATCQHLCGWPLGPGSCSATRMPGTNYEIGNYCGYTWMEVRCYK